LEHVLKILKEKELKNQGETGKIAEDTGFSENYVKDLIYESQPEIGSKPLL